MTTMPHRIWRIFALLVLFACPHFAAAQQGDVARVLDPSIIKAGKTYYLFSTGKGIKISESDDLFTWRRTGVVFDPMPEWMAGEVPGFNALWAPDISLVDGEYRLYYAISTWGSNRSCIALATNKTLDRNSPDYRWVDRGKVIETNLDSDWNAIDAQFFVDADGGNWLTMGSFWSGIKLARVDRKTGMLKEPVEPISLARRPGADAIEAPFLVRRGEFYYLFTSFDQCGKGVASTYNIRVGRSRSVTGPFVGARGGAMTEGGGTLVLAGQGTVRGPGHNAVFHDDRGDWLLHHYYDATDDGRAKLQIRPLLWTDDGWPLPGEPLTAPPGTPTTRPASPVGKWNYSVDCGEEHVCSLLPNGNIEGTNGQAEGGKWSLSEGRLLLRWPKPDSGEKGGEKIDQCVISPDGATFVGRNRQADLIRGRREQ